VRESHFRTIEVLPLLFIQSLYIEIAVVDDQQGVVFQLGGWAWGSQENGHEIWNLER
jgi:hypothetical protein